MALRGYCTICTDFFGCDAKISVTLCGHLFHGECLQQWLKQCGTHRTCPQCRSKLTEKQIVKKLFINVPETEEGDLDPYHLKNRLDDIESRAQKLKIDKKKLQDLIRDEQEKFEKLTSKNTTLKKKLKESNHENEFLRDELKRAKELENDATSAKNEAKRLQERLKLCERVEFILESQKSQVDEMMQQYANNSHNMLTVTTMCTALKQEFESIKVSRNKAKDEVMKWKREVHKVNQELLQQKSLYEDLEERLNSHQRSEDQLTEENKSLRRKLDALQRAMTSPSDTRASAISRLIAESPAPLMMTPDADWRVGTVKQQKRLSSESSSIDKMKKPKLSPSLTQDVTIDLDNDDANGSFIAKENEPSTSYKMKNHTDSPQTVKTKKVCHEMGLNFVKVASSTKISTSMKNPPLFRAPLANKFVDSNRTGSTNSHFFKSPSSRFTKVKLSSKAKPFTSKPVMASMGRPKLKVKKTGF
ncbi:E3 ubiquitin-protein ligase TRAIP-like [Styela clava]